MEQTNGGDSVPSSGSIDKSRVLDVKPLRSLAPVFSSAPNSTSTPQAGTPFACVSPSGPFPPGVTPFYPFFSQANHGHNSQTQGNHSQSSAYPISAAVPLNSFRTPSPRTAGIANGSTGPLSRARNVGQSEPEDGFVEEDVYSDTQNQSSFTVHMADGEGSGKVGSSKGKPQKRKMSSRNINVVSTDVDINSMVNKILSPSNLTVIASLCQAEGDHDSVGCVLMIFNLVRRKIAQIEETREPVSGGTRRPDLKAGTLLMTKGIRTNINKRVGTAPGVEIGDIFFFRFELCLVGLHAPSMAGIDYMSFKSTDAEESMAVSIVSSGGYEDDVEDGEVLIYSGQGGVNYRDREASDQKLERGNLALSQSARRGNQVRVLRGLKDIGHPTGKVYVYDGLYTVQEHWVEKGKSGCSVFKYKLERCSGQPAAYMIWKSIQQWRDGVVSRTGVILPDLTSGEENIPVSLVNDVDGEKGPSYFTYSPTLKYLTPITSVEPDLYCNCNGGCLPGNLNCRCIQKNGGYLPYTGSGILVNQKSLLYECGSHCSCPPSCRNRVSQGGLKVKLEVFKTKTKGWGLRSWDPIRAGAFICEYAGEAVDSSKVRDDDDYIFDGTRTWQQKEVLHGDFVEAPKLPFPLTISAKNSGNVSRFMNHSCSPNVSWQPVLRANDRVSDLHISFHASKHIPPMTELTYDYGVVQPDKAYQRKKKCLCGSKTCKGYFF